MFVGHYAAAIALKGKRPDASLGMLFVAVQFVDILFFPLVVLGVERMTIIDNYTASTHFSLDYMPWTHSLVAAVIWSLLVWAVWRFVRGKTAAVAVVMGLAVFSHWLTDLLVHTPDLPLWHGDGMKVGFGLWESDIGTFALEAGLLLLALNYYLGRTRATSNFGRHGMIGFVGIMLLINAVNIFGPNTAENTTEAAAVALALYVGFALTAAWLDRYRTGLAVW